MYARVGGERIMDGGLYSPAEMMREALEGREAGGFKLRVRDFRKGRTDRETYFNVFLEKGEATSTRPVAQGLYFMGRGEHIRPWVEFRYDPGLSFSDGSAVDLEELGLTPVIFSLLGGLLPPGGSMMVIYGGEGHPLMRETEKGLKRGFPPHVTPLGYHLWREGFRWFKDWYFPEGWLEGAMKLQATRPLDEEIRARREAQARQELSEFVSAAGRAGAEDPLLKGAVARAESILAALGEEREDLR